MYQALVDVKVFCVQREVPYGEGKRESLCRLCPTIVVCRVLHEKNTRTECPRGEIHSLGSQTTLK